MAAMDIVNTNDDQFFQGEISLMDPYPEQATQFWNKASAAILSSQIWDFTSVDAFAASVRALTELLAARCPFTGSQVSVLSGILTKALDTPALFHIPLQIRLLSCLSLIFRRYRKCTDIQTVDWTIFYRLLSKVHLDYKSGPPRARPSILRAHQDKLLKAIHRSKRFFSPDASEAVLKTFWTQGDSPHNISFYQNTALVDLFMPTFDGHYDWVPVLQERMARTDPCVATSTMAVSLLSRTAKSTYRTKNVDLSGFLPVALHWFLQHLPLSIDGSSNPNSSQTSQLVWPKELDWMVPSNGLSKFMAKLMVYCISDSSPALTLMSQFFHTTATFFHPSNGGPWTNSLADFLYFTSRYFSKRFWKDASEENPLSSETTSAFLDIVVPVASDAIYSRSHHMVFCAQDVLRHLAYVAPDRLFPKLLSEVEKNLEDSSQSTRLLSSISFLASASHPLFSREVYPSGAKYLHQFLFSSLDHLDGINFIKSVTTLSFFGTIFYIIPFLDGFNANSDSQEDEEARHSALGFNEWSLAFVAKVCDMLKHLDAFEKSNGRDTGLIRVIYRTCRPFFCSLSQPTHLACVKFIVQFLSENTQLSSRKFFGVLLRVAALGQPSQTIEHVFQPLLHRICGPSNEFAAVKASIEAFANQESEWFLYLAASCIRECGGEQLASQVASISVVVTAVLTHKSKNVRKMGRKLVRNTLKALTETYATEFRPFPPYLSSSSKWEHWRFWGTFSNVSVQGQPENRAIDWHIPQANEIFAAEQLVQRVIGQAVPFLSISQQTPVESVLNQWMNVRAVFEGCLSVAGNFEGKSILPSSVLNTNQFSDLASSSSVKFDGKCLREWLLNSVLSFSKSVTELEKSGGALLKPELWIVIISICDLLFNAVGVPEKSIEQVASTNKLAIRSLQEFASGRRCVLRPLLVEQSFVFYLQRMRIGRQFIPVTSKVVELFELLQTLAVVDYSTVRSRASNLLSHSCDGWPHFRSKTAEFMVQTIRSRNASEQNVLGAVECLRGRRFSSWVSCSWEMLSSVIIALCDCSHHNGDIAQASLIELFSVYADRLHLLPVCNSTDIKAYSSLVQALLDIVERKDEGAVHWRSTLIATRFLHHLVRNDIQPSSGLVNYFWRTSQSNIAQSRRLAVSGMTLIVLLYARSSIQNVAYQSVKTSPPTQQQLSSFTGSDTFYHTNDSGWLLGAECTAFVSTVNSNHLVTDKIDLLEKVRENILSSGVKQIVASIEQDHPKLAGASSDSSFKEGGASSIVSSSVDNFISNRLFWPSTSLSSVHDALVLEHTVLVSGICLHIPEAIGAFIASGIELSNRNPSLHNFRDAQVSSAEIFAGVASSSKYWSDSLKKTHSENLITFFNNGIDKCPSDSVKDWSTAVRYACTDVDPRCISWLTRELIEQALPVALEFTVDMAPFQLIKRLQILQAILIESAWRAPTFNDAVASRIAANSSLVANPYTQVRQEVSRIICFVLRNSFRPGCNYERPAAISTIIRQILDVLSPSMLHNWNSSNDTVNALETGLFLAIFCCSNGEMCYAADVVVALTPIIICGCSHPNAETAALAKHCMSLVSWSDFEITMLDHLIQACRSLLSNTILSWHVRVYALKLLSTLTIRHAFKLDKARVNGLLEMYEALCSDSRAECRDAAAKNLTALFSCVGGLISVDKFIRKFMKKAKADAQNSEGLLSRHAALLALSALIRSEPYRIPEWMPMTLAFCAPLVYDPAPIGPSLQKVFTEFMRTHQDTWHIDQEKFSEDELTAVKEATVAPSYFA
uniref:Proteasome activator complex subunit 4 C-terminal domain-containing protein n=1 Tax=Spongospora subterranea TaxID=70186 RepID=A0A0H5R0S6_9EUKA|eukprot:CRZ07808.1 hypothetical protein [Spongospora subterranea]